MVLKKVKDVFVVLSVVGTTLWSSPVLAMDPPPKSPFASCDPNILGVQIGLSYFHPSGWTQLSRVSWHWNKVFTANGLWKLWGRNFSLVPHTEKDTLIVDRVNLLIQDEASLFKQKVPISQLLLKCFNTEPTGNAFKNLYLSKHRERLNSTGLSIKERVIKPQDLNLESAYEEGHPIAAWKLAIRPTCVGSKRNLSKYYESLDLHLCLDAALGGYSKAKGHFFGKMLSNPNLSLTQFNLLIQLAHVWPEGREAILRHPFPLYSSIPHNLVPQFEELGRLEEGKAATLSLGQFGDVPFDKRWPDALLICARKYAQHYREALLNPQQAHELPGHYQKTEGYLRQAFEGGAYRAALEYAKFSNVCPDTQEIFERLKSDPNAFGTYCSKMCQHLINAIPAGAEDNDPSVLNFFAFLFQAYAKISEQERGLPPSRRSRPPTEHFMENMEVQKPRELIAVVTHCLHVKKVLPSIQYKLIDWVLTTPYHENLCDTSVSALSNYLFIKWGNNFYVNGVLDQDVDKNSWTDRDTLYARKYFSGRKITQTVRNKFESTLRGVEKVKARAARKAAEERTPSNKPKAPRGRGRGKEPEGLERVKAQAVSETPEEHAPSNKRKAPRGRGRGQEPEEKRHKQ